jgi:hypothetical protein
MASRRKESPEADISRTAAVSAWLAGNGLAELRRAEVRNADRARLRDLAHSRRRPERRGCASVLDTAAEGDLPRRLQAGQSARTAGATASVRPRTAVPGIVADERGGVAASRRLPYPCRGNRGRRANRIDPMPGRCGCTRPSVRSTDRAATFSQSHRTRGRSRE